MWESWIVTQIVAATVSFIASLLMIIMIARSKTSSRTEQVVDAANTDDARMIPSAFILSSSPYHRIIFGISFSDTLSSLAVALGPFALPSNVAQARWGIGNNFTCTVDGLMAVLGILNTAWYAFILSFFCLCKVKFSMTNDDFSRKFEWKLHFIIIVHNLVIIVLGLVTQVFNPLFHGNFCIISNTPTGCIQSPEIYGECDTTIFKYVPILSNMTFVFANAVCLPGIIICMSMVCWHAMVTTKSLRKNDKESIVDIGNQEDTLVQIAKRSAASIVRRCRMEFFIQAGLYVLGYMLTNTFVLITHIHFMVSNQEVGDVFNFIAAATFPLAGLFNILIYTRPKVVMFRKQHPRYSWMRALVLVVKSGGVVPMVPVENEDADPSFDSQEWIGFRSIRTPQLNDPGDALSSGIIDGGNEENDQKLGRQYYPDVVLRKN